MQRTYGNQALILKDWGRLEEAFELHKKEEALCLQLGNRSSLGYCYFDGDVWRFVEQADSLGIKDIDSPAKRPSVQDALKELNSL